MKKIKKGKVAAKSTATAKKKSLKSGKALVNNDSKRKEVEKLLSCETFYSTGRKATEEEKKHLPRLDETFNETVFGPEIDLLEPRTMYDVYNAVDKYGSINLLPPEVWYISVYNYNRSDPKYDILNTLPDELFPLLSKDGAIHGTLTLDYPFEEEYMTEFDFKTTNDVLAEIKKGFLKMYASLDEEDQPYGETYHSIIFLRVEELRFNTSNNRIYVSIGS